MRLFIGSFVNIENLKKLLVSPIFRGSLKNSYDKVKIGEAESRICLVKKSELTPKRAVYTVLKEWQKG